MVAASDCVRNSVSSMTELATNIAGDKWGIGYAGFGAYNKANADGQVLTA